MEDLMRALEIVKAKKAKVVELQEQLRAASEEHQNAIAEAAQLHDAFSAEVNAILPPDARKR